MTKRQIAHIVLLILLVVLMIALWAASGGPGRL